jgi:hypothetical protein
VHQQVFCFKEGLAMKKRFPWITMVVAALFALAIVPAAFAQGNAKVRVVHASPDAPAVDVFVNGNKALSNVPFFTASSYLDLPGGSYDIKVTAAGDESKAVIDAKGVTIEGGKAYTIAAVGKLAEIKPAVLADNLAAPASGKAKVRVIHASPDAPAVDVKVKGGATLISNLAFPNASNYLEVDAGSYDLQVTPAGASDVVIDLPGTKLEAGKIYDVFAVGLVGDKTLKAQPVVTTPAAAPATGGPSILPTTSGEELPIAAFALMAVVLLAGGLVLRRRA